MERLILYFVKDYLWDVEEVKDEPTVNPGDTTKPVVSVKTGDSLDIMPYALGTLLGIASLSGMLIKRKRSHVIFKFNYQKKTMFYTYCK